MSPFAPGAKLAATGVVPFRRDHRETKRSNEFQFFPHRTPDGWLRYKNARCRKNDHTLFRLFISMRSGKINGDFGDGLRNSGGASGAYSWIGKLARGEVDRVASGWK